MNPTGYHRASGPFTAISPATPRNDAAERYSPEMAAAFQFGPTDREATRKSLVVRAKRSPVRADDAGCDDHKGDRDQRQRGAVHRRQPRSSRSVKSRSIRSACRRCNRASRYSAG